MTDRDLVQDLCAVIGSDFLLAQGAGGNISWKDEKQLWIKASGTWLREATLKDIFVPVDLEEIYRSIASNTFEAVPTASNGDSKRPSIETWFHALLPWKFVLHIHALDVLALLIRRDSESLIKAKFESNTKWKFIEYYKPGEKLARRISEALIDSSAVKILFLESHGIVIGADSIKEVEGLLDEVRQKLGQKAVPFGDIDAPELPLPSIPGYSILENKSVNQLAINPRLWNSLKRAWAIAPDHVVFLGREPVLVEDVPKFLQDLSNQEVRPKIIFVRGAGVFSYGASDNSTIEQLLAYFELLARQPDDVEFKTFSKEEIDELLNWEAEKYRQQLRK